eukprot:scaffold78421_cov63-Phaeocystis_antarctica.AAC.3
MELTAEHPLKVRPAPTKVAPAPAWGTHYLGRRGCKEVSSQSDTTRKHMTDPHSHSTLDDLLLPSLVAYLLVADDRGQLLPSCRRHGGLRHSFLGRALPLCDGTLELETATVTSNHARPCARSCVVRRLRGLEEGRTADGAASREYDGRRARAMGIGPPFELASSPPSMWTVSR